jgi:hypothetical protein
MPRTTDAPTDADVPTLAEQVMPLLVANCPGIQCKMVGACCYSRCHATKEIARHLDEVRRLRAELAAARPVVAAAEAHRAAYVAWHNWRPAAGMGHGHADRYAETREALLAALAARDSGEEGEGK